MTGEQKLLAVEIMLAKIKDITDPAEQAIAAVLFLQAVRELGIDDDVGVDAIDGLLKEGSIKEPALLFFALSFSGDGQKVAAELLSDPDPGATYGFTIEQLLQDVDETDQATLDVILGIFSEPMPENWMQPIFDELVDGAANNESNAKAAAKIIEAIAKHQNVAASVVANQMLSNAKPEDREAVLAHLQ